jgi:hypothetical protein
VGGHAAAEASGAGCEFRASGTAPGSATDSLVWEALVGLVWKALVGLVWEALVGLVVALSAMCAGDLTGASGA